MRAKEKPLTRQIAGGLFWVACGKGAQALLQFTVVIVLARLISPADFGLIAAALIVVGFSEIITELGFEAAIVQREKLEKEHLATAFAASLVFGCAAALLLFLAATAVSRFLIP
jgi:PST family polysaccharide transporter